MRRMSSLKFFLVVLTSYSLVSSENIEVSIVEDLPPGSIVCNLKDKLDQSSTDGVSFVFLSRTNDTKHFHLDSSTGVVRTASSVDRDRLCPRSETCSLELNIAVQPSRQFRIIKLIVKIDDLNDNAPRFPKDRIRLEMSEGVQPEWVIPIPSADDLDSPANGIQGYDIRDGDGKFRLVASRNAEGSFDLGLVLVDRLDREVKDAHQMTIVAYDGGTPSKSGSAVVEVSVTDENDNPPRFGSTTYKVEVKENAPATRHLQRVNASDPDLGPNGKVLYRLSGKSRALYGGLFSVDKDSGWVSLIGKLDYETNKSMRIEILAENEANVTSPDSTYVTIDVIDVNDNVPQVTMDPSSDVLQVDEHSKNNTVLAAVSVFDPDSGPSGKVNCSLHRSDESASPHFRLVLVAEKEYTIVTASDLDREVVDIYHLVLVCRDEGQPVLETRKNLRILIDDIDDHNPQFTRPGYNISVMENNTPLQVLLTVSATDTDSSKHSSIVYNLSSDADPRFTIDQYSGEIRTTTSFDRERADVYQFHVRASDEANEQQPSTRLVTINVLDDNDEAPMFLQPEYVFNVSEDVPVDHAIGHLDVHDKDLPPNNRHIYSIQNASGTPFHVDPASGTLSLTAALDREKRDEYRFMALVRDADRSDLGDSTMVRIHVQDVNDNPPRIHFPTEGNDTIRIPKTTPVGQILARVVATDSDSGNNGKLSYALLGHKSRKDGIEVFSIDSQHGDIRVDSRLNRYDNELFDLQVYVKDGGSPPLTSQATLHVIVRSDARIDSHPTETTGTKMAADNQYLLIGGSVVAVLAFFLVLILLIFCSTHCVCCGRKRALKTAKQADRSLMGSQTMRVDDDISRSGAPGVLHRDYGFGAGNLDDDHASYTILNRPASEDPPSLTTDSSYKLCSGCDTSCSLVASPHQHRSHQNYENSCLPQHARIPNNTDFSLHDALTRSPQLGMHGKWPPPPRFPLMTDVLVPGRSNYTMSQDYRPLKAYDDLYFNNHTNRFDTMSTADSFPPPLLESPYLYDNGNLFSGVNSMERPKRRQLRNRMNHYPLDLDTGLYNHPVASRTNVV